MVSGFAGVVILIAVLASGVFGSADLATGVLTSPAKVVASVGAANGQAVAFGTTASATPTPTVAPTRTPAPTATPTPQPTPAGTIFSDDFPGTSLSSAWQIISRHGEYAQNETECNVPGAVGVSGGIMTITTSAQAASCGDFNVDGSVRHAPASWPYTTGDIQWKSQNFTYGTVTVRAKFPPSSSHTWPAIWLLGSNCQNTNPYTADVNYNTCPNLYTQTYKEIDMVECWSGTWCQLALAQPSSWPTCKYSVDSNWHTFSMTWTSTAITTYVDGKATGCGFSASNGYVIPSTPMFLIIQTQTGGLGGTPAGLPTQFQVSQVTVTQP